MIFRFPIWPLLAAGVMAGMILPVHAQTMKHGRAIFFTGEQSGAVSNAPAPSLLPQPPSLPKFEAVTGSGIDLSGAAPALPRVVMPAMSAADAERLKDAADKQKNWALMTPEEIFGLPTPEKIMGVDPKDRNQTAADRYYERQQHLEKARTNGAAMFRRSDQNTGADSLSRIPDLFSTAIENGNNQEQPAERFFGDPPNSSASRGSSNPKPVNSFFSSAFSPAATAPAR